MSKIIILSGLPASGKSTKAQEMLLADGHAVRLNKDLIRTMLHFDRFNFENEDMTRQAVQTLARLFLGKGKTVIIDDTNLNEKTLQSWKILAKDVGARIQNEFMDTSMDECIRRDRERGKSWVGGSKSVGEHVIVGMALSSGLYPKPERPVVLCDIDGTLANIDHRLHYVKAPKVLMTGSGPTAIYGDDPEFKKDWSGFFTHMMSDTPRTDVVDMLLEYEDAGHEIFFISARPDTYRAFTEDWIVRVAFNGRRIHNGLFMRGANDSREDSMVKKDMYEKYFKNLPILSVIDDRPRVIRMWRELGLNVTDVGNGIEF